METARLDLAAADASCAVPLCDEVCRLHPCSDERDCVAACEDLEIPEGELRAMILRAANTPGVCTCDICSEDSFGFCTELWTCQQG